MEDKHRDFYIFIDESGNIDFSEKGTRHFVLTAIATDNPFSTSDAFNHLKYGLIPEQLWDPLESFHASEDKQVVRDRVFNFIQSIDSLSIYSIVVNKRKFKELWPIETSEKFYSEINSLLMEHILIQGNIILYGKIVIIVGALMSAHQREFILKSIKLVLKSSTQIPFVIYFIKSSTDLNCQLADYCSWAIYVKAERSEMRPYEKIKNKVRLEIRYPET